jgi:hypothetical protein
VGTTVTNQNCIHTEIKSRLNLGNACYHYLRSLFSSSRLIKNIEIKIYKAIILSVVLYGCENWPLTLEKQHRLRVFEYRVLRSIFGPKGEQGAGGWRRLYAVEHHNLYASLNIIRVIKFRRMRWAGYVARMAEMRNAYSILNGKPEAKDHLEDLAVDGKIILQWILGKKGGR